MDQPSNPAAADNAPAGAPVLPDAAHEPDAPAVILVVAMALFSTLGVSGKLSGPALVRHFGHAAVRAGWIGFLIGVVLTLTMADPSSPDFAQYLMRAGAVAVLTPLYGYGLDFLTRIIAPQN